MCAGRPSRVCDAEPLVPSSLPICWRNFPSGVNFRIWSPSLLPPSQTLPSRSTWMPCSFLTQAGRRSAPPQEASRLPSGSNFSTGGAALQHLVSGGFVCAPFSSSSSVAGRWMIQMLSCAVDGDAGDLAENPVLRQRLRPERLGLEFRRGLLGGGHRAAAAMPPRRRQTAHEITANRSRHDGFPSSPPVTGGLPASVVKSGRVRKVGGG